MEAARSLGTGAQGRPAILLTTSGMLDFAFSRELLTRLLPDERTTIALVGWQDPLSPGGQLARMALERGAGIVPARGGRIETDCGPVDVQAEIVSFRSFSGHGDSRDIDSWLANQSPDTAIYLLHGDADACEQRAEQLRADGYRSVHVPHEGQRIELRGAP